RYLYQFQFITNIIFYLRTLHPIILAEYIQYYNASTKEKGPEVGWLLAGGVILISFLNVLIYHHCCLACQRIGMRVRIACCSLVYRKLLKLSQTSLGQTAAGQLVNFLSNDVQRFDQASIFLHYIWIMPIQCVTGFYVMYRSVGIAALAGMIAMALEAIPLQGYLSKLQGKLRFKIAQRTDHRVKLMSEIVSGIQVIKMYAWEKSFEKVVELARKMEIDVIKTASYIRGLYLGLTVFTERLCLYLTLITFVLLGNRLTGDIVFSMAQLFNTVQLYMAIYYPTALSAYAEAKVSIKRLEEFLLLEENEEKPIANNNNTNEIESTGMIKLVKANATWRPNPIADTLMDINIHIDPGKLCCVVGNVGSGKTSLLQTILKELPLTRGRMEISGRISYASQEPWLFVSSVRNNILLENHSTNKVKIENSHRNMILLTNSNFKCIFDCSRYYDVVRVCALEKDFKQFPYGDKTLVGERGVSLSGGQRARINLARAVYKEADIYLFDDPLSAVDTHVGKQLFEECLKKYLKHKTRILVTHQLQFLKEADLIIVMNNGKIDLLGTFNDLTQSTLHNINNTLHEEKESTKDTVKGVERMQSIITSFGSSVLNEAEEPKETHELIEKGVIPTSTYAEYYRSGARTILLLFAGLFLIIAQISANAADFWVTHWTNMEELRYENEIVGSERNSGNVTSTEAPNFGTTTLLDSLSLVVDNSTVSDLIINASKDLNDTQVHNLEDKIGSQDYYIIIYTICIISSIILTPLSRNLCYLIFMNASKVLHNKMFHNILQAPMRFFDTNPSARAPVFSHISASLYGLPTIRSCDAERMIIREFDLLQDQHTSTFYLILVCSETFGFYLDVISTIFLAFVTFQFMVFRDGKYENVLSANVGLVISQAMVLTGMLQIGPRQTAEVAGNMISVERVLQYCKLEKEGPFESLPTQKPTRNWPQYGKITFKNTYLWYDPAEPPVLKNLNIEIQAGEKVHSILKNCICNVLENVYLNGK
ncbi:hypothetical protein NQ314_016097, partial [Rhamnusium bicolor]